MAAVIADVSRALNPLPLWPLRFPTAHAAGLVTLQVLEDTVRVSSSVLFEYRPRSATSPPSSQLDWLSLEGEFVPPHPPLPDASPAPHICRRALMSGGPFVGGGHGLSLRRNWVRVRRCGGSEV